MTLDAAEVLQVTEIAARVAAEMTRNAWRGTGGATIPLPVLRYGTVGGTTNAGAEASVRADGDSTAVPAINATGMTLEAGDRVLVEWRSPSGVFIVSQLARASRGNWTPSISGPSSSNVSGVGVGHYTRIGHKVTVYGTWTFGASSAMGTAATLSGLPFPVISDGDGIPAQLNAYFWDSSAGQRKPGWTIVPEGTSVAQLYCLFSFSGSAVFEDMIVAATGAPFTWASGDEVVIHGTYDTDAA